jgi:nitrite reductase (NADH) small subunit/3-phenylpropionate/trans-cinnamate dioxygenase ferredoxin subunit
MSPTRQFDGVTFTLLDDAAGVAAGQGKHYEIDGRHLAAFRLGERVFVTEYRCPHAGRPLTLAAPAEDCTLTCPVHAWKFSLETGANFDRSRPSLPVFEVRQEDGLIFVRLP